MIERHYYRVPILNAQQEGKPEILSLQDFNGDGKAFEFAVYDADGCMALATALFGYSEKQDKLIQYPVILKTGGKTTTAFWAPYLFSEKPGKNGFWKFAIDYRGREGTLDKYEFHYAKATESFNGTLKSIGGETIR